MDELADNHVGAAGSMSTSGIPSYEADSDGVKRDDNNGSKSNLSNKYAGGTNGTNVSRTLMISGIPPTYCTKEFLQRHFQVSK